MIKKVLWSTLVCNINPLNFVFTGTKYHYPHSQKISSIKTFLTLKYSQCSKKGHIQSKPVAISSNCHQLGNNQCLCLPLHPAKAVL